MNCLKCSAGNTNATDKDAPVFTDEMIADFFEAEAAKNEALLPV